MAGELKPVPTGAEQIQTFQFFQKTCQDELDKRAKAAGKAPVKFDLSKAQVFNRADGDGKFEIVYNDESLDFNCSAQVLWQSQEILIRGGSIKAKTSKPLAGTYIADAATLTEKLVGKEEFAGQVVKDGVADSRMVGADKYLTVQNYSKQCQELLDQFSRQKYGLKLGNRFDLKNVRIVNEIPGDGFYDLLFENHANNFFCEGQVDSSARRMVVVAGSLKDKDKAEPTTMLEMKDTCSMTSGLLGKDELVKGDECKDITGNELTWKHGITGLFSTYVMYVGIKQGWKLYNKLAVSPRFLGFARLPVIRNLGWGAFTYLGYDAIASNFFPEDH